MNLRRLGWCLLFAALFTGCRKDAFVAQYIEQINNQNRELEDQQYELEYELDKLREENVRLKQNNSSTTKARGSSSSGAGGLLSSPRNTTPQTKPSLTKPPMMEPDSGGLDLEPPVIETPQAPAATGTKKPEVPPVGPLMAPEIELPNVPPPDASRVVPKREQSPAVTSLRNNPPPRVSPAPVPPEIKRELKPEILAPKTVRPSLAPEEIPPAKRPAIDFAPPEQSSVQPTVETSQNVEAEELPAPKPMVLPDSTTSSPRGRPAWIEPPPVPPENLSLPMPTTDRATTVGTGMPGSQTATKLFFHPEHTRGIDLDNRPGDDGLSLLIEPQNGLGDYVPQVGKISVVLLDPALEGSSARVARWDFDTEKVLAAQSVLANKRGISLTLPWPTAPPQHSTLRLFVRMETAAGEQLQNDQELTVTLPGSSSQQRVESWTPRTAEQNSPPSREVARRPDSSYLTPATQPSSSSASRLPAPPTWSVPAPNLITPPATIQEPAATPVQRPTLEADPQPFQSKMIVPPPALGDFK